MPTPRRRKLSEDIAGQLNEQIVEGTIGAEEVLPAEAQLAADFQVSARVVREALQMLAGKGLVELRQGRRARVRPTHSGMLTEALSLALRRSNGNSFDLLEVRRPLETEIARLAAGRASQGELAILEGLLLEMDRLGPLLMATNAELLSGFVALDLEFHRMLGVASHNPIMLMLIDALGELLRATRFRTTALGLTGGLGFAENSAGHWAIYHAVRDRDVQRAGEMMERHLAKTLDDIRAAEGQLPIDSRG